MKNKNRLKKNALLEKEVDSKDNNHKKFELGQEIVFGW